jgi:hypothetical protein
MLEHSHPPPRLSQFNVNFLHPGSGEIVHPVTIDGNRKGADGGIYSTRLHDDDIPPPFFFNHLVTVVPFTFIRVNYIIRPSLCFCFGDVATTRKK